MSTKILNRDFKHPEDGWYQIEAKGYHPALAADGTKVLQVIDDRAVQSIVSRFNTDAAATKLPQGNEMLIDHEHFRHDKSKETRAYGWANKLRVSPDGSGIDTFNPWTATGKAAVDGGDYRFTSTEYDGEIGTHFEPVPTGELPVEIRNKYQGFTFLRPLQLTGLSLTNDGNNKGQRAITITNKKTFASSDEPADSAVNQNKNKKMKTVCTLLGLSADADETSVHSAVAKLQNRITTLEPMEAKNIELTNRLTQSDAEQVESLMDAHGIGSEKPEDKAKREKLKPVLVSLKNRADRLAFLTEVVPVTKPAELQQRQQTQLHNRNSRAPGAATETAEGDDKAKSIKITNRANELKGTTPSRSFDSCWTQAKNEQETK